MEKGDDEDDEVRTTAKPQVTKPQNCRTFHLDSVFIVRSDHLNSSHRAGRGGGLHLIIAKCGGGLVLTSPQQRKGDRK
jgi:hypothetical protein